MAVGTVLNEDGIECAQDDDATTPGINAVPICQAVAADPLKDPLQQEIREAYDLLNFDLDDPHGISLAELQVRPIPARVATRTHICAFAGAPSVGFIRML